MTGPRVEYKVVVDVPGKGITTAIIPDARSAIDQAKEWFREHNGAVPVRLELQRVRGARVRRA